MGPGEICEAEEANRVISATLAQVVGGDVAKRVRILYVRR